MVDLRRLFKDYRDSGTLHELVSIQSALGNGVFVTKSGSLLMFVALGGTERECMEPGETDQRSRRFESILRLFDERFRLYQYLFKRHQREIPFEHADHPLVDEAIVSRIRGLTDESNPLYIYDTYVAIVYEGWKPQGIKPLSAIWKRPFAPTPLSLERVTDAVEKELELAKDFLINRVASFVIQCRDLIPIRELNEQEAFTVFRRLLNYTPFKADGARLKSPSFVDFQACNSDLECHRDYLRLDDWYVQTLTLKEPPTRTFAEMLSEVLNVASEMVVITEWKRESAQTVRRLVQSKRRHFHNSKSSFLNYVGSTPPAAHETLIDDGAAAMVGNLGACLEEIEVHGRSFGGFSLTLLLYSKNLTALKRAVAQAFKVFSTHDAQLTEERYNHLNAWLAIQPGNSLFNLRRFWLTSTNYADLSFLFTPANGQMRNEHLGSEYLAALEASGQTPYFLNLHVKDVAHTFILGATGSGKSFLLNFLITHLQKFKPYIFIFDLGGGYQSLTRLVGGTYLAIGKESQTFTINPFCLPPTRENLLFLFAFVKVLIAASRYEITHRDEIDLFEQIENLYSVQADQRRLSTLANIVSKNLRGPLQKWVHGGPYGGLFDNASDNLTFNQFQCFDFQGMDTASDQCEALLFYILHRANAVLTDTYQTSVFKAFVMDEAWKFFRHPVVKAYIVEALKIWRSRNAAMILATQSGGDLFASEMLSTLVESCATQIHLANPGIDRATYKTAFNLNDSEVAAIADLIPKQQMLLKQPGVSKVLSLNVDPKSYWLYTNNAHDNVKRQQAFERHGLEKGLEILASEFSRRKA